MGGWGANKDFQIGISSTEDVSSPILLESVRSHVVLSAAGGDSFTCVACNTGVIIVWGTIEGFGVLKEPTVVPCSSAGIRFVKVVCGAQHVIALSETGQVYSFGANGCGQLGIGRISDAETHLVEVSRLKRIRVADIAAGGDMSMVLTETGFVFVWGLQLPTGEGPSSIGSTGSTGSSGSIGSEHLHGGRGGPHTPPQTCATIGTPSSKKRDKKDKKKKETVMVGDCDLEIVTLPRLVDDIRATFIGMGRSHLCAVSNENDLYMWGLIYEGSRTEIRRLSRPKVVTSLRRHRIVQVSCGWHFTLVILEDGGIWSWGCGDAGQLGRKPVRYSEEPRMVHELEDLFVKQVACGEAHVLATDHYWLNTVGAYMRHQLEDDDEEQQVFRFLIENCFQPWFEQFVMSVEEFVSQDILSKKGKKSKSGVLGRVFGGGKAGNILRLQSHTIDFGHGKPCALNKPYATELILTNPGTQTLRILVDPPFEKPSYSLIFDNVDVMLRKNCEGRIGMTLTFIKPSSLQAVVPIEVVGGHRSFVVIHSESEVGQEHMEKVRLDDIDFEKKIGTGGSLATVWRASWKGECVAVKFWPSRLDGMFQDEIMQEIRMMCRLSHPNVVSLIGASTRLPDLFVVMEFMENGSLWDLTHKIQMQKSTSDDASDDASSDDAPPSSTHVSPKKSESREEDQLHVDIVDKVRMALEAAHGVQYLHERGIIHRDLKSQNLLLDSENTVKVADLGISRFMMSGQTMTGQRGTPHWMAPEVIEGLRYTEKADVYSFGVILWELVSESEPFRGVHHFQVLKLVSSGERPTIPSDAHPVLKELIQACWAQNPSSRPVFTDIILILEDLMKLLTGKDDVMETMGFV